MTYRYRGHSVADAGLSYRTRDETGAWIDKDPIALLRQRLLGEGMSEEELVVLERYVDERVSVGPTSRPRSRSSAGIYAHVSAERGWADGSTAHEHHGGPRRPSRVSQLVWPGGLLATSHDSHHHHDVPTSSPMDHGSLESARAANRLVGIAVLCC
jgi:hypothetical protein